jgi:hypothetical protein
MSTLAYRLNPFDALLTDGVAEDFWLHDLPKNAEELHVQALVASGDYFEMLAAILEQVARALPLYSVEQYQTQYYVQQLLYLQRTYKITKKV